jgi:hypothetical protein
MYCSVVNAQFINIAVSGKYNYHSTRKGYIAVLLQISLSFDVMEKFWGTENILFFSIYLYLYYVKLIGVENVSKM